MSPVRQNLQLTAAASLAPPPPVQATRAHEHKMRRIRRVERSISNLERLDLGYLLGGARDYANRRIDPPLRAGTAWTDCTGFILFELAVANVNLAQPCGWTGTLAVEGEEGTSPYLTVFLKDVDSVEEGHGILRLRHHPGFPHGQAAAEWRWAECGGIDNPKPGGGPTWFKPTQERIDEFTVRRRFKVLT